MAVDGNVMVNGPEGGILDWNAVDWRQVEEDVRRLRQRIFAASQAGDLKKVRNLQKLTAPIPRQRTAECAAGDGAERRAGDGGRGRQDGNAIPGQGRMGQLGAAPVTFMDA